MIKKRYMTCLVCKIKSACNEQKICNFCDNQKNRTRYLDNDDGHLNDLDFEMLRLFMEAGRCHGSINICTVMLENILNLQDQDLDVEHQMQYIHEFVLKNLKISIEDLSNVEKDLEI